VAANLAEAGYRVLLLEAGPPHGNPNYYRTPALSLRAAEDPAISWDFFVRHYTETAAHGDAFLPDKGGVFYPRSSTLGGCTAHHAMVTSYPAHSDWEHIRRLTGDEEWDPERMWGHWERVRGWQPIENILPPAVLKDLPLAAVIASFLAETAFLPPGNVAVGTDPNARINVDRMAQGFAPIPQATRGGVRVGPRERLLAVASRHPSRLSIATGALVERIVLEKDPRGRKRAVAVKYLAGEHLYAASPLYRRTTRAERKRLRRTVRVRKEVIVAGGAFNSPQILMLSGIGPRRHLEQHGIDVKVNLPGVGSNLQDNVEAVAIDEYDQEWAALADCGEVDDHNDPCFERWNNASDKSGELYSANGFIGGIKRRYSKGPPGPELGIGGTPTYFKYFQPGYSRIAGARPRHFFTWLLLKAHPGDRAGTVRLRSKDPTKRPRVNKRSLGDNRGGAYEIAALIEALQTARQISSRIPFPHREIFPGSGADLEQHIRRNQFGHHASCSNPIGADGDRMAVLDGQLRVRGTRNVRVVDASSFPRIPAYLPWAPTAILSEKASQDILADAD
jgi:choline dehydrogenase